MDLHSLSEASAVKGNTVHANHTFINIFNNNETLQKRMQQKGIQMHSKKKTYKTIVHHAQLKPQGQGRKL